MVSSRGHAIDVGVCRLYVMADTELTRVIRNHETNDKTEQEGRLEGRENGGLSA